MCAGRALCVGKVKRTAIDFLDALLLQVGPVLNGKARSGVRRLLQIVRIL